MCVLYLFCDISDQWVNTLLWAILDQWYSLPYCVFRPPFYPYLLLLGTHDTLPKKQMTIVVRIYYLLYQLCTGSLKAESAPGVYPQPRIILAARYFLKFLDTSWKFCLSKPEQLELHGFKYFFIYESSMHLCIQYAQFCNIWNCTYKCLKSFYYGYEWYRYMYAVTMYLNRLILSC